MLDQSVLVLYANIKSLVVHIMIFIGAKLPLQNALSVRASDMTDSSVSAPMVSLSTICMYVYVCIYIIPGKNL